jgi:sugar phosphate isomerase/epimerase
MVSRRTFLETVTGALMVGGIAESPNRPIAQSPNRPRPFGIQLYAVRDVIQTDPAGTLAALAGMGYREVELAGLYGRSAAEFRAALDAAGLTAPAGHVGVPALTDNLVQTIADAKVLGHKYLILPWVGEEYRTVDGWGRAAELLNRAGERCRRAGLTVGYHNHDFEFAPLGQFERVDRDGRTHPVRGYDLLLANADPKLVKFELDLYWARQGGVDALRYFHDYRGRFRAVHVKDMAADGSMVDVGQGVMDWPALLHAARRAGVEHFFAEHDEAKDQLAFARASAEYLRTLRL